MTEIGLRYERSVMENFKAEQSPDGQPWQRLSAATLMQRLGQKNKKGHRFGFNQKGGFSVRGKRYLISKRPSSISPFLRNAGASWPGA